MRYITNPVVFHDDNDGNIRRFLGVEMEISDFDPEQEDALAEVVNRWSGSIVADGSLRGENCFELRTSPARGIKFVEQMRQICRVLRAGHAKANKSCGLHVHIDARDLEPMDLVKIAALWPKVEDKFYAKTFKRRADNGYAQKWSTSLPGYDANVPLIRMYNNLHNRIQGAPNGRMMGLNFQAMSRHSTIENRIHHGTINITKILHWAKMNADFIDYAIKSPIKDLPARAESITSIEM